MDNKVPSREEAPRTNLFMRSGNWVNLYDPSVKDIVLEDWVVGASRAARWGGQTKGETAFNVLQHSLLVEDVLTTIVAPGASLEARFVAMCHDLHEGGGLGDIVTPYGRLFSLAGLGEVKGRLDHAIFGSVGLAHPVLLSVKEAVKQADMISAVSEAVQLMDWPERLARRDVGDGYEGPLWTDKIVVLNEQESRAAWWERFREFKDMVKDANQGLPEGCRVAGSDSTGRILKVVGGFVVQSAGRDALVAHELGVFGESARKLIDEAVGTGLVLRIRGGRVEVDGLGRAGKEMTR